MGTTNQILLVCLAAGLAMGCPKKGNQPTSEPAPTATATTTPTVVGHATAMALADLGDFDQKMADDIVKRAIRNAQGCTAALDKTAKSAEVGVVFDGEKGRITDVALDGFSGISEQGLQCIRNAFTAEVLPPFAGGKKTVKYTLELPAVAPAASAKPEKKP
ncbi:MAG: hypothetical protein HY908_24335 [Myxococcales bacterium]|nr:hypothetical protein [Myxococcales bacterium]